MYIFAIILCLPRLCVSKLDAASDCAFGTFTACSFDFKFAQSDMMTISGGTG